MTLTVALYHPNDPQGPCLEILPSADDLDNFDEFHHFAQQYGEWRVPMGMGQIMVAWDPVTAKLTTAFLGTAQTTIAESEKHLSTIARLVKIARHHRIEMLMMESHFQ